MWLYVVFTTLFVIYKVELYATNEQTFNELAALNVHYISESCGRYVIVSFGTFIFDSRDGCLGGGAGAQNVA